MEQGAPEEAGELRLLGIQATTLFELTESGRLRHENSPDRSPAPRLWMGGSAAGNIIRLRFDVREETAHAIDALVAREPPMSEAQSVPVHIDKYAELLGAEAPVEEISRGITYVFPDSFEHEQGARVVSSNADEGQRNGTCAQTVDAARLVNVPPVPQGYPFRLTDNELKQTLGEAVARTQVSSTSGARA